MGKFYAVREGRKPGVYHEWEECRSHVIGFPGAKYKKFTTEKDAWDFVHQENNSSLSQSSSSYSSKRSAKAKQSSVRGEGEADGPIGSVVIYTDGSCIGNSNVAQRVQPAGWGFVALRVQEEGLQVLEECFGPVCLKEGEAQYLGAEVTSNNTAELSALGWAMKWVLTQKKTVGKTVVFRYDSKYAANSITGVFNGKKNRKLVDTVRDLYKKVQAEGVETKMVHVKGHSNDRWNDRADHLAQRGAAAWRQQSKRKQLGADPRRRYRRRHY